MIAVRPDDPVLSISLPCSEEASITWHGSGNDWDAYLAAF